MRVRSLATASLVVAFGSHDASAAIFLVTRVSDSVDESPGDGICRDSLSRCSVRAAVMEANAWPGPDSILLPDESLLPGTFSLTIAGRGEDAAATGDLDVTEHVWMKPDGFPTISLDKRTLDAVGGDRLFHVRPGGSLELAGVILSRGDVGPSGEDGGGILNETSMQLNQVLIRDCIAGRHGGGIFSTPGAYLELDESTVYRNRAAERGGGIGGQDATTIVQTSSVSMNRTGVRGGGIATWGTSNVLLVEQGTIGGNEVTGAPGGPAAEGGGGVHTQGGYTDVRNCTVASNVSINRGGGLFRVDPGAGLVVRNSTVIQNVAFVGGGLFADNGIIAFDNTIVSGNGTDNCNHSASGSLISGGHNLADDLTCNLYATGDLPNTIPMLGPLQENGGKTLSRAPLPGSPVIHAGDDCLPVDQRGVTRPQFSVCDIGSVEYAATVNQSQLWPQKIALGRLREVSLGPVVIGHRGGFPSSVSMDVEAEGSTSEERAWRFLDRYADLYLQTSPDVQLVHVRTDSDPVEGDLVRFAQTYRGFPVYGAEIVVHLEAGDAGALPRVTRTSGMLMPTVQTDTPVLQGIVPCMSPAISEEEAVAVASGATGFPPGEVRGQTDFVVYDARVFGEKHTGLPGVHLAYRVTLGAADPTVALVDSHDGGILFQHALSWTSGHRP